MTGILQFGKFSSVVIKIYGPNIKELGQSGEAAEVILLSKSISTVSSRYTYIGMRRTGFMAVSV